jgi:hypothetical protein
MLNEKWISGSSVNRPDKALARMQTTLRFVCTAQLGRYMDRF